MRRRDMIKNGFGQQRGRKPGCGQGRPGPGQGGPRHAGHAGAENSRY